MKNKILLSSLISAAMLTLTACGGGGSDQPAQHPAADVFAPVISIKGADEVVLEEGKSYADAGATATDNVDPSVNVVTSGFYNTNKAGTYTLTYSATDLAGNTATATRTIKVIRKPDFAAFDGKWEKKCVSTDAMFFGAGGKEKLEAFGITYVNQIVTFNKRDIKVRLRGFDNSSCSGAPKIKGSSTGRIVYTGEYLDGSYTGEKVDLDSITEAHFSREDNKVFEVAEDFGAEKLDEWAVLMGMPKYQIFAKANDTTLVEGTLSLTGQDGSVESERPTKFNATKPYTKK